MKPFDFDELWSHVDDIAHHKRRAKYQGRRTLQRETSSFDVKTGPCCSDGVPGISETALHLISDMHAPSRSQLIQTEAAKQKKEQPDRRLPVKQMLAHSDASLSKSTRSLPSQATNSKTAVYRNLLQSEGPKVRSPEAPLKDLGSNETQLTRLAVLSSKASLRW